MNLKTKTARPHKLSQKNAGGRVIAGFLWLALAVLAGTPAAVQAASTNTFNFYNTAVSTSSGNAVGLVTPANGVTSISGAGLNVGDVILFDGVIVDAPGSVSDAWGAINLNGSGYAGLVNAALGVLVETGTASGNPCQLFLNGSGSSTKLGVSQGYQTNRVQILLTCTAAGSTTNMNYLVLIDQGATGTFGASLAGTGVTFANNTISLTFGANNASHQFMPIQSTIVAATTPGTLTVAAGVKGVLSVNLATNQGYYPLKTAQLWLANGVPIPNATNLTYTTPATNSAGNGTQYSIVLTNLLVPGNVVTSTVATLVVRSVPGLVPFIFAPTTVAGNSQVNPLNPPSNVSGIQLLAGDTVVFDGVITTNGALTGSDAWIAVNLLAGGYEGVTSAQLGLLVRVGTGTGQLYVNGSGLTSSNPTSSGALTNRARIELYPSVTGTTTNMGWLVKVDQNLTGTFLPAVSGTNLTFPNNTIPLSFGSDAVAGLVTPLPIGLQTIQNQLSSSNLVVGGFEPSVITENFLNLSNVLLAATAPGLAYASSNTNVLTISTNGFISAVGAGQATVTVSYASFSATNLITVFSATPLASVTLGLNSPMVLNSAQQLSVLGNFANVSNINLFNYGQTTFVLSSTNIVNIATNGVVTAIAPGTVTISAVNSGVTSAPQQLTVTFPTNVFVFDTFGDGFWNILNKGNSKNLVVNAAGASQATSTNTAADQQFEILYNFPNSSFRICNRTTAQCFGASPNAPSNAVVPVTYNATAAQQWYLMSAGNGYYRILNGASGLVLQSDNGQPANVTLASLSASPFQLWSFAYQTHFPKKGCAGYDQNYAPWGLGWAYNYDDHPSTSPSPTFDYVPMIYAAQYYETISDAQVRNPGWLTNSLPAYIMTYNEPDNSAANGGSNTGTNNAIANWPNIQALNLPIVSPACATTYGAWMNSFFSMVASNGYRVDYTALHEYVPPYASSLISTLKSVYNSFGRPVWLTEFSPVDWSNTQSWSENDDYNFLAEFMWQAESSSNEWLKRYAIFPFSGTNSASPWVDNGYRGNYFLADGATLAPYGELYAAWDADLTLHARTPYIIHNLATSFRLTATNNISTPQASTIYVRNATTEWGLLPAPTTNHWYIVSLNDGRRLRNNNGTLDLAPYGTVNTNVDWWFNGPDSNGYYYLDNLNLHQSLKASGSAPAITMGLASDPATTTATQWRLIKPYQPVSLATAPPPAVAINYANHYATLNWAGNGLFYNVYRSLTAGGPYSKIVSVTAGTNFTDGTVQNGTAYYYVVTTLNALGDESAYSTEVAAHPALTTIQPVSFALLNNGLQFNWPADHIGWRLTMNTNSLASTNWVTVTNSISTNQVWLPFDMTQGNVFFRLVFP